ncbi:MAG TPA: hypothetical protein VJC08_05650 [bacterium]|nr:hypothetical protein [bacterium]
MKIRAFLATSLLLFSGIFEAAGNEILRETQTQIVVRQHPYTGNPYVVVTDKEKEAVDPFAAIRTSKAMPRPDYRLLDPKIKSGQIAYEGPVSDRKKVYIFAASLATLGTVGGAAIIAAAPAATGAGATGGAGVFAGAGAGIAAGTVAATAAATKSGPPKESFQHTAQSREIDTNEKN